MGRMCEGEVPAMPKKLRRPSEPKPPSRVRHWAEEDSAAVFSELIGPCCRIGERRIQPYVTLPLQGEAIIEPCELPSRGYAVTAPDRRSWIEVKRHIQAVENPPRRKPLVRVHALNGN